MMWLFYGFVWIPIAFVLRKNKSLSFGQWYKQTIVGSCDTANRILVTPIARWVWKSKFATEKSKLEAERNHEVDQQITALRQELDALQTDPAAESGR